MLSLLLDFARRSVYTALSYYRVFLIVIELQSQKLLAISQLAASRCLPPNPTPRGTPFHSLLALPSLAVIHFLSGNPSLSLCTCSLSSAYKLTQVCSPLNVPSAAGAGHPPACTLSFSTNSCSSSLLSLPPSPPVCSLTCFCLTPASAAC